MFEPLEIIYRSPFVLQVAFTVGLLAAVTFAATFFCIAIRENDNGKAIKDRG